MKLALEFVEYHSKYWNGEGQHPQEIATALREALAEQPTAWVTAGSHTAPLVTQPAQQEPAAWQDTANHMKIVSAEDWENIDPMWHWMYRPLYRPLYPSPSQREPLLREIAALSANALDDYKMIQKLIAQRQPLTDEEICRIGAQVHGFLLCNEGQWGIEMARAIEAAHGIKENT